MLPEFPYDYVYDKHNYDIALHQSKWRVKKVEIFSKGGCVQTYFKLLQLCLRKKNALIYLQWIHTDTDFFYLFWVLSKIIQLNRLIQVIKGIIRKNYFLIKFLGGGGCLTKHDKNSTFFNHSLIFIRVVPTPPEEYSPQVRTSSPQERWKFFNKFSQVSINHWFYYT